MRVNNTRIKISAKANKYNWNQLTSKEMFTAPFSQYINRQNVMGDCQAVRHGPLEPVCAGSNPAPPATFSVTPPFLSCFSAFSKYHHEMLSVVSWREWPNQAFPYTCYLRHVNPESIRIVFGQRVHTMKMRLRNGIHPPFAGFESVVAIWKYMCYYIISVLILR